MSFVEVDVVEVVSSFIEVKSVETGFKEMSPKVKWFPSGSIKSNLPTFSLEKRVKTADRQAGRIRGVVSEDVKDSSESIWALMMTA